MARALRCAALVLSLASIAHAQPGDVGAPSHSPAGGLSGVEEGSTQAYWERGKARWFFAATLELGFAYARPKLAAGRGRPHWEWAGLETLPLVTAEGAGWYGGVRGEVPNLDARIGFRYFSAFERVLLQIEEDYERLDIESKDGPASRYLAYEAEVVPHAPVPGGSVFGVLTGYYIPNVAAGYHLYEESLKVVMSPPFVWRARLGYAYNIGPEAIVRVGPAVETIGLPGRDEYVWRAGLAAVGVISSSLDVQVTFLPVISSPDSIGLAGADFGHLGVRWRWATGAPPK